jgi:hypothetical protein
MLTVANSAPGLVEARQVQIPFGQAVVPHWCRTWVLVMSSLTPATEVPGTIVVVLGWGRRADAPAGNAKQTSADRRAVVRTGFDISLLDPSWGQPSLRRLRPPRGKPG